MQTFLGLSATIGLPAILYFAFRQSAGTKSRSGDHAADARTAADLNIDHSQHSSF
jgi:hypothetical protein